MLISTLPSLHNRELTEEMFSNSIVGGVRYNIGMRSKYSPKEVIYKLTKYSEKYDKLLWIDLKGRQLRITKWADPAYGDIEMNRKITTTLPAKVYFRGDSTLYTMDDYFENKIYIYPDPLRALGAGQALNILSPDLEIVGDYLNPIDIEYVKASKDIGLHDFMLSFVEKSSDAQEVLSIDSNAKPVLKIENIRGIEFVLDKYDGKYQLLCARDDLSINLENEWVYPAAELIITKNKDAIVGSKIFESLKIEKEEDYYDTNRLLKMGYHNFMFDDTISHRYFKKAMNLWRVL